MSGSTKPGRGAAPVLPAFGQVVRGKRLVDAVAEAMGEAIITHRLPSGTPLPSERELGEQFGVSRTVIREAVRMMAAKGLIEVRTGSGLRVAEVNDAPARESLTWFLRNGGIEYPKVHEVRTLIEIEMAGIAATRRSEQQLAVLTALHKAFAEALAEDPDTAAKADLEFHMGIARATDNQLFDVILDSISAAMIDVRRDNIKAGAGKLALEQQARILDAIAAGDADRARLEMKRHIELVDQYQAASGLPAQKSSRPRLNRA